MPDAYSGNRTAVKLQVNNTIIRNHMPYTYMALILSEQSEEMIDALIGSPVQEEEELVLEMTMGEVYKLPVVGKGDKGAAVVKWSSSNEDVASVNAIGLLAAKKAGDANLTATASNGKQAVVEVHVAAE
jgi:hypothetical protein